MSKASPEPAEEQPTFPRPGTVADVEAGPDGPKVGAFIDFDGTLIAGYSAMVFARDRYRRRLVTRRELTDTARLYVDAALGRADFTQAIMLTAQNWAGEKDDDLVALGERLFESTIADRVYPEMKDLVASHRRKGHTIVLASSATRYQVGPLARALGVDHVLCTELEVQDGVVTGRVVSPPLWGPGKAAAVQQFAAEHGVDLKLSYAYADGDEDEALLHLVGKPRATNPKGGLARVAERRGWPILRFSSRGRTTPLLVARNLAATASIVPAAVSGLVGGLASGSRRTGANIVLGQWVDMMFALQGVRLNVIGTENAWSHRPAVFIFNHRNNFDTFVAAKIVREDATGVGKKELARNPITGPLGKAMGAVFIDRTDREGSVAALQQLTAVFAEGLSIVVAPEGRRHRSSEVGEFKKGPFRMAMAGGVPIVPIVIRNVDAVAPYSAFPVRSGTVDVCVLPPVPVDDWSTDNLAEKIEEVRQSYIETLRNWPGPVSS